MDTCDGKKTVVRPDLGRPLRHNTCHSKVDLLAVSNPSEDDLDPEVLLGLGNPVASRAAHMSSSPSVMVAAFADWTSDN
jgi:hypothetical protein